MSTKNGSIHIGRAAETNGRTARLKYLPLLSMVCLIAGHAAYGVARAPAAKEGRSVGRENERARSVSVKAYVLPGSEAARRSPGPDNLSTGFEPGQGFVPGFVGGQQAWVVSDSLAQPCRACHARLHSATLSGAGWQDKFQRLADLHAYENATKRRNSRC